MEEQHKKHVSKFLSLILRHKPETIDLELDENGWADVKELMMKMAQHQCVFTKDELEEVVATNDKKRFAFNETHTRIRASQGHSLSVDLSLKESEPPEFLYHGTAERFLEVIKQEGLMKMSRQHVHLSSDKETATKVGGRHGKPVVLRVNSGLMHKDGIPFYLSENNVWLTDAVPVQYID